MDRIKNYFIRPWDSDAMLTVTPISPNIMEHFFMVYFTLFNICMSLLFGAISHLLFNSGGWISAIGFIVSVWWMPKINPWREIRRLMILILASFLFGATFGPLINLIIEIDQRNVIKIFFGGILFFSCYVGSITQTLERTVMYQLAEYSAPIVIFLWMTQSDTYPGAVSHVVCFLCLPFQWYVVVQVGAFMGRRFRMWFNMPVHIVWILFLCFCFEHSVHDVMFVYVILTWLFVHMNLYNQLTIFRAIQNCNENYYVSTAITFFTEFPVHIIHLLIHIRDVMFRVYAVGIMIRKLRTRPEAPSPTPRGTRTRGGRR